MRADQQQLAPVLMAGQLSRRLGRHFLGLLDFIRLIILSRYLLGLLNLSCQVVPPRCHGLVVLCSSRLQGFNTLLLAEEVLSTVILGAPTTCRYLLHPHLQQGHLLQLTAPSPHQLPSNHPTWPSTDSDPRQRGPWGCWYKPRIHFPLAASSFQSSAFSHKSD